MKSYGRITVTAIKKVGVLMVNPSCNMPLIVTYDPDNDSYTPDWRNNNLVISPIVTFDGEVVTNNRNCKVTFTRMTGNSGEVELGAGEVVNNNQLTVSVVEPLSSSPSDSLTYCIHTEYTDVKTGVTLTNLSYLNFSLNRQASVMKYAHITGETAFLYNTNQQIQGSDTITLEGYVTGVSISEWQYKNAAGNFVSFPTTNNASIKGNTLTVKATESIFTNDKAVIKLCTTDSSIFDIITIAKIRDGAAGGNSITAHLSNDSVLIPARTDGTVSINFTQNPIQTILYIFEGGQQVYPPTDGKEAEWRVEVERSSNDTAYIFNPSDYTYSVTQFGKDVSVARFVFICTHKTGKYNPVTCTFSMTKITSGADGKDAQYYEVKATELALNRLENGNLNPGSVNFYANMIKGDTNTSYNGRFKIYQTSNVNVETSDESYALMYTSTTDERGHKVRGADIDKNTRSIKCELYAAGSDFSEDPLDTQTVVIVSDGATGADGEAGKGGISIQVTNEYEGIPCDPAGKILNNGNITIPFYAYVGIERAEATVELPAYMPDGMANAAGCTITSTTASRAGSIVIPITKGKDLGGADNGTLDLTFKVTVDGTVQTMVQKFSWGKSKAGANGKDSAIFQIYTPNGLSDIVNKQNNVTLATMLNYGGTIVTATSYEWDKLDVDSGQYVAIAGQTKDTLTVTPSMVDGMAAFCCKCQYSGGTYTAYFTVSDKTDPWMVSAYCSLGTQLVNPDPDTVGAIFTLVLQNGNEIDAIKSKIFKTEAPTNAKSGDYYYKLDTTNKTCTLMKYDGSKWEAATPQSDLTYKYYRLDGTGNVIDTGTPFRTGKAIFINMADLNPSLDLMIEVNDTK